MGDRKHLARLAAVAAGTAALALTTPTVATAALTPAGLEKARTVVSNIFNGNDPMPGIAQGGGGGFGESCDFCQNNVNVIGQFV